MKNVPEREHFSFLLSFILLWIFGKPEDIIR